MVVDKPLRCGQADHRGCVRRYTSRRLRRTRSTPALTKFLKRLAGSAEFEPERTTGIKHRRVRPARQVGGGGRGAGIARDGSLREIVMDRGKVSGWNQEAALRESVLLNEGDFAPAARIGKHGIALVLDNR